MPKRTLSDRLSLRQRLTLPHAALLLAVVLLMGALSWQAGRSTVDGLAGQLLVEAVSRVAVSVERHVGGADATLEAAFPTGLTAPESLERALPVLRERFWLATSVHREPNNYVYYGDRRGHFLGLWRFSEQEAELRLRTTGEGPRTLYRVSGIAGTPRAPVVEDKLFDPRERPWFTAALAQPAALAWTPVYVDFRTGELIVTRTRRVGNEVGEPEGVVATDLPLQQVNALLGRLTLSANAVAMVVEADGRLIGVSRGAHLQAPAASGAERLNARQSGDALVAGAYAAVQALGTAASPRARSASFQDGEGRTVQVGHVRLDPALGLDWQVIAAVPQADFLGGAQRALVQAAVVAGLAALAALALGWLLVGRLTRDLHRLAEAAQRIGAGLPAQPPGLDRADELGEVARSLDQLQRRPPAEPPDVQRPAPMPPPPAADADRP